MNFISKIKHILKKIILIQLYHKYVNKNSKLQQDILQTFTVRRYEDLPVFGQL